MDINAERFAQQLRTLYPDEQDRLLLWNKVLPLLTTDATHITKVQGSGLPELLACRAIGLNWNGKSLHGADATDDKGNGVELKTYRRVQNGNRVSIMYTFPPRHNDEAQDVYIARVVNFYLTDEKFVGGHYWVAFDQAKQNVLYWHHIDVFAVATLIKEYLERNPTAKTKNFGGALCAVCKRCHAVELLGQVAPKQEINCKLNAH